jgi:hypothetical protein
MIGLELTMVFLDALFTCFIYTLYKEKIVAESSAT